MVFSLEIVKEGIQHFTTLIDNLHLNTETNDRYMQMLDMSDKVHEFYSELNRLSCKVGFIEPDATIFLKERLDHWSEVKLGERVAICSLFETIRSMGVVMADDIIKFADELKAMRANQQRPPHAPEYSV